MDKRYQVFVSSTFRDLAKERLIAFDSILQAGCFPACMENFPVLTGDSLKYIYKLIDESDFLLLILGGRYGSSRDSSGVSYTHLEARYALKIGKPIIALYPLDWGKLDDKETSAENISKLVGFIEEIKEKFDGAKPWTTETLSNLVYRGVEQAIKDHPEAVGWVRANAPELSEGVQGHVSFDKIVGRLQRKVEIKANILYAAEGSRSADSLPVTLACTWEEAFLSFAKKIFNSLVGEELCIENVCEMLVKKYNDELKECLKDKGEFRLLNIAPDNIDTIRLEFATNELVDIKPHGSIFTWRLSELGVEYLKWLHEREFV